MKIFVSSTVKDLGDLRDELYRRLKELGHLPWFSEMTDFPTNRHPDSMTNCIMVAEECDLFVVLLDKRAGLFYTKREGSPYQDLFDLTISEAEYKSARKKDKKICIFIRKRVDHESNIYRQITDPELRTLIKWYSEPAVYEFYDRLMHEKPHTPWRYTFDTIDDIIRSLKLITGEVQNEDELTEHDILKIREGEKKDSLQKHMDDIINSFRNEQLSSFRDMIEILDRKWNIVMEGFNKSSNTRHISSYFAEHYRTIIYKLIERKADYEYYYPIIKSLHKNIIIFLSSKISLDEDTYLADISYFSNVFSSIIKKSIDKSNYSVLGIAIDMLIEQMNSAIKAPLDDFRIYMFYIRNLDSIVEASCKKRFEIDFISVRLSWVGIDLASSGITDSLEKLLNTFDSLIDLEIKWNDEDNLIITQRSLMYIWVHCKTEKTKKCSEKIISILKKTDSLSSLLVTLYIAYDKTEELLKDDEERENLIKITNHLEMLRKFHPKIDSK